MGSRYGIIMGGSRNICCGGHGTLYAGGENNYAMIGAGMTNYMPQRKEEPARRVVSDATILPMPRTEAGPSALFTGVRYL
jgi:hypothetical protein